MTPLKSFTFLLTAAVFMIATAVASEQNTTLKEMGEKLKIDEKQISVSGISSGGFMAHQLHVAHSANLMGAGIIAGGPYYCAEGDVNKGMIECTAFMSVEGCKIFMGGYRELCMRASYIGPDKAPSGEEASKKAIKMAENSINVTKDEYKNNYIDNPKELLPDRVMLIHGKMDILLPVGVMDALYQYYKRVNDSPKPDNLVYLKDLPVAHAVPTDNSIGLEVGNQVGKCDTFGSPYLNFCDRQDCTNSCCPENARPACGDPTDPTNTACALCDPQCSTQCVASIDSAGRILKHIYSDLAQDDPAQEWKPRNTIPIRDWGQSGTPPTVEQGCMKNEQTDLRCQWLQERLYVFNQEEIATLSTDLAVKIFLAPKGFLFVPPQCVDGRTTCKLHIAFHGCRQGYEYKEKGILTEDIKTALYSKTWTHFVENAGYNKWADANNIVVLYPQARTTITPLLFTFIPTRGLNPQGCWDFWGYTDRHYHTKNGQQISAVWRMVEALVPSLKQ